MGANSSALSVDQIFGVDLFFLVLDDGRVFLTYLLLGGFGGECFFASAFATDCKLVVDDYASRTEKFLIYG